MVRDFYSHSMKGFLVGVMSCLSVLQIAAQNQRLNVEQESVEPFQIFDNVYYVGTSWVSCYAVETSIGIVLIDALYGDFPQVALDNLKKLGLGNQPIVHVLATHGHWDHAGGAAFFQKETHAVVGMTAADWTLAQDAARSTPGLFSGGVPERELVVKDGELLVVGDTTFHCFVTPGHTEGVLSLEFEVRDGDQKHRAFVFGGVGLNFSGVDRTKSYLASVARIRALATQDQPIEVFLSNHPGMGRILDQKPALLNRSKEGAHPFVDGDRFLSDLDQFRRAAEKKLKEELARAE